MIACALCFVSKCEICFFTCELHICTQFHICINISIWFYVFCFVSTKMYIHMSKSAKMCNSHVKTYISHDSESSLFCLHIWKCISSHVNCTLWIKMYTLLHVFSVLFLQKLCSSHVKTNFCIISFVLCFSTCQTVYLHVRMWANVPFTDEDIHLKSFHVFSVLFPHVDILIHMWKCARLCKHMWTSVSGDLLI